MLGESYCFVVTNFLKNNQTGEQTKFLCCSSGDFDNFVRSAGSKRPFFHRNRLHWHLVNSMHISPEEIIMVEGQTVVSGPNSESSTPERVCVLMVGALPLDLTQVKGGVEAVILNLFQGFRNIRGVRVVHVAFTKETKTATSVDFAENIVIHFLPFRVGAEIIDYAINDSALQKIIQSENPQIIHIQEITPHILRFLKYRKSHIVVTQHGIMREELKYASGIGQKLKCIFKAGVEKYVFPIFRHVIFISKYNQKLYPARPVHGVQIFNPVNPIFFAQHEHPVSENNSLVYVGVLSRRKNIRIVVEALYELKKTNQLFKLHVIGGFKESAYETEIMSLVKECGLGSQIIFHGWMKQEQIREIYKDCPIFVLPSLQETLPVSIAEAMALGKVVVATDVGAINEMFTDQESGFLFRKNDRQHLVNVLQSLHDNPQLPAIGERARKEALEKFHPTLIAEKTMSFYREIIEMSKAKGV
jgi:glycosyltransferase involved in cell wall biosynthesis